MDTTPTETTEAPEQEAIIAKAEEQAAQDAALMAMLKARDGAASQPAPRRTTLGENFVDAANLIQTVKQKTRLNEGTLVKLWELTLMWQLNNRQSVAPSIYEDEEEQPDLPEPHEIITAVEDGEENS